MDADRADPLTLLDDEDGRMVEDEVVAARVELKLVRLVRLVTMTSSRSAFPPTASPTAITSSSTTLSLSFVVLSSIILDAP